MIFSPWILEVWARAQGVLKEGRRGGGGGTERREVQGNS